MYLTKFANDPALEVTKHEVKMVTTKNKDFIRMISLQIISHPKERDPLLLKEILTFKQKKS